MRELEIAHGIHRERSLNHPQQVTQVLFIPEQKVTLFYHMPRSCMLHSELVSVLN